MTEQQKALEALCSTVSAPSDPVEVGDPTSRGRLEKSLGFTLPSSFYALAQTYGSGRFQTKEWSGLVHILNPFSVLFEQRVVELAKTWSQLKKAEGENYLPFDLYPKSPGLLPIGYGDGERLIFYYTQGDADEWPILVWAPERTFHRFEMPVTTFLANLFTGQLSCWGAEKDATWFQQHKSEITFRPKKKQRTSKK